MSRSKKQRARADFIDLDFLAPPRLRLEETLEIADSELEGLLQTRDVDRRVILINEISKIDRRLEFVLAVTNEQNASMLTECLLDTFPLSVDHFQESDHRRILRRFSESLPRILGDDVHTTVCKDFGLLDRCLSALKDILERDLVSLPRRASAKIVAKILSPDDSEAFRTLGFSVPPTKKRAESQLGEILQRQKQTLRALLDICRDPHHYNSFRDAYLSTEVAAVGSIYPMRSREKSDNTSTSSARRSRKPVLEETLERYPLKLVLDGAPLEGFGKWPISLSGRAAGEFRDSRKSDYHYFEKLVERIRELSHGHFKDANGRRLTSPGIALPIFEANFYRNHRILYHRHTSFDVETNIPVEGLRILAIIRSDRISRPFWDAAASALSRRERQSATLNPTSSANSKEACADSPPLSVGDLDLMQLNNLVLDKSYRFSQTVLDALTADRDAIHVFEMSPQELEIALYPKSCYVIGRSGTGKTTVMLNKIIGIEHAWKNNENYIRDSMERPRQVFVTKSSTLANKVKRLYHGMSNTLSGLPLPQDADNENAFEGDDHTSEIFPAKYSELGDDNFPLFLSLDQLYQMLDADLGITGDSNGYSLYTFRKFLATFGVKCSERKLDPSLVFAEFMSVIKGSVESLGSESAFIDRQTYLNLSERTRGTFSHQRDVIYDLFERYQKKRGQYDSADRAHKIHKALQREGIRGVKLDRLYVDEVQDILMIDALVLRSLCSDRDGLFWAGDTAQTISAGSFFRFEDLRAFMYLLEEANHRARAGERVLRTNLDPPKVFELNVNYRSHAGIINCANTVVQLITRWWPTSIDVLPIERTYDSTGVKPTFVFNHAVDGVINEAFIGQSGDLIELGADQCIIVRNDEAKQKLRTTFGDIGLVFTLYESKGLEFNTVLLYNFFEDSFASVSQWSVLVRPVADMAAFGTVCHELKCLYVGITRARHNLWVVDSSERCLPMRDIWKTAAQIDCKDNLGGASLRTRATRPEDWANTARYLFQREHYSQAAASFERAHMPREQRIAEAYYLQQQAQDTDDLEVFKAAGHAFVAIVEEYPDINPRDVNRYYSIGARCLVRAEVYEKAAEIYRRILRYESCLECYEKAKSFEGMRDTLRRFSAYIPEKKVDDAYIEVKKHYVAERRWSTVEELFSSNRKDVGEFMKKHNFAESYYTEYLEFGGHYFEAANIHSCSSDITRLEKAHGLYSQVSAEPPLFHQSTEAVLSRLWRSTTFAIRHPVLKRTAIEKHLVKIALLVASKSGSGALSSEARMFKYLLSDETPLARRQLVDHAHRLHSRYKSLPAALLMLDQAFRSGQYIHNFSADAMRKYLDTYWFYTRSLRDIINDADCSSNPVIRRVYPFTKIAVGSTLEIPRSSPLFTIVPEAGIETLSCSEDVIRLSSGSFNRLIRYVVGTRLKTRIDAENTSCHDAEVFRPVDNWRVSTTRESQTVPGLQQARLIIRQMTIYHCMSAVPREIQLDWVVSQQRSYWLGRLYRLLYKPHEGVQTTFPLPRNGMPEIEDGMRALRAWVSNLSDEHFVTHLLVTCFICAELGADTLRALWDDLKQIPFVDKPRYLFVDRSFVPLDCLSYFLNDRNDSLDRGVLFLGHILSSRLMVDIQVLCDYLDRLCAMLVVAGCSQSRGMDNVVLPENWFALIAPHIQVLSRKYTNKLWMYAGIVEGFLLQLHHGVSIDHIQYENRAFGSLTDDMRALFISRICRNLYFLGYNGRSQVLSDEIRETISAIGKPPIHPFYVSYVNPASSGTSSVRRAEQRELAWVLSELGATNKVKLAHLHGWGGQSGNGICSMPGVICRGV